MKEKIVKKQKSEKAKITDLQGNEIKRETIKKEKVTSKIKKHIKKYSKLYGFIGLIIVGIILIVSAIFGIRNFVLNKKYGKYEEKIIRYGYSILYENNSAKSSEKLTRIELAKMILGVMYNTNEIESRGFQAEGKYEGEEWARAAFAFGIVKKGYITEETYKDSVTYEEAIRAILDARTSIKKITISNKESAKFKNLDCFSMETRRYINDAAENGLIENNSKKLNLEKTLNKGEFNKLIVTLIEKYNLVAPEGETLVLKSESLPSNQEIYPYILYSVDKSVYEYEGFEDNDIYSETPSETYETKKDYYSRVKTISDGYYNAILNIDYRTIDKSIFYNSVKEYLRYNYQEEIEQYIDYVKENKIVIEGSAKIQLPIFYLDGMRYRARIKLTYEIKNSDTDKNILLGDLSRHTEVTYKGKKYETYIDAPMGTSLLGTTMLLDMEPIIDMMVNDKEASSLNEF